MTELGTNLAILLVRELRTFEREIDLFGDDERIWSAAPGCPNAAANSALHVAGNLRHYVGAVLGGTGYVRNREREFGLRSGSRGDVKEELRAAIRDVSAILPALPDAAFAGDFPELVSGLRLRTDRFLMHLCAHAAYHLGQADYARRAVTGDGRSCGPDPLSALTDERAP
jgi:hypothetical protein